MRIWPILLIILSSQSMAKESITLTLASQLDGGHRYFHELLYVALTEQGYHVTINVPSEHIPQKRVIRMVENNQLSLTWLIASSERDQKYTVVDVPLTQGLIGKRVMLIPPQLQPLLDDVNTLQDMRETGLVAGLGMNWFDVDIWQANGLSVYKADGEWRSLYNKLSEDGVVNYFPRGVNEVVLEAEHNPHLAIERRLMFVYQRDMKFYLSDAAAKYKAILERALKQAEKDGVIERLVKKHWGESYDIVDPDNRIVVGLELPQTSQIQ